MSERELSERSSGDGFPYEDAFPHAEFAEKRAWILQHARRGGGGVELGVFRSHFSAVIMRELEPHVLHLVDPWRKFGDRYNWAGTAVPDNADGEPGTPYTEFNRLTTQEAFDDARRRMLPWASRAIFNEDFEQDWCARYVGPPLDFAYLDSSHFYLDTLQTLMRLDRILASDGVILGDDWYHWTDHYSGVCRAVNDFVRCFDYEIIVAGQDAQFALRRTPHYTHEKNSAHRPTVAELLNRAR